VEIETGSTRSHSVENLLCKCLGTSRKADCTMMMMMMMVMMMMMMMMMMMIIIIIIIIIML
jgi:hypothetical protein